MRIQVSRRSELLIPLALLIPALLGRAEETAAVLTAYALARLCTLYGAEAFRRAAAQEIAPRRVRGAWTGTLLLCAATALIAWHWSGTAWEWLFAGEALPQSWTALRITGVALALARLNEEYLRAAGQGESAALCAFVRAILLTGGVLCGLAWAAGAAALGCSVSFALAWAVGGCPFAPPNTAAFKRTPIAALREFLYPIPALLLLAGFWGESAACALAGYLLGLAMFECAVGSFRRNRSESSALHIGLLIPAILLCAIAPYLPQETHALAALVTFSALMGMLVNAALTLRGVLSSAFLAISCLSIWFFANSAVLIAPLSAAFAAAMLFPDAQEVILQRRALCRRARYRKPM